MTPTQIIDVQRTFAMVVPIREKAAELFYGRLFEIDPSTKPLFKGNMAEQGRKLMSALALVIASLTDLPNVLPAVQDMARRHVGYGVEDRHYDSVGNALLWTLGQGLGEAFTPQVRDSWATTYAALASVMKQAARDNRAAA